MVLKTIKLSLLILVIGSCYQKNNVNKNYKLLARYALVDSFMKLYDNKGADSIYKIIDKQVAAEHWDSLTHTNAVVGFRLLLNNNYYDSAKKVIPKYYAQLDSNTFRDLYFELRRLETVCHTQLGMNLDAIKNSFAILPYYEKNKNYKRICGLNANIGWSYFNLLQWENAKKFTLKAIAEAKANKFDGLLPDYYQRMGAIFSAKLQFDTTNKISDFKMADDYFDKSLALMDTATPSWELSNLYINKGGLYILMKKFNQAISLNLKAEKINTILADEFGLVQVYNNLGNCYINLNDYSNAEKYFNLAVPLTQKFNDQKSIADLNSNLAVLYFKKGDYKKSAINYKDYVMYHFNELNTSKDATAQELAKKYETAKIENELIKERNLKLQANIRSRNIIWFSVLALLLIGIVVFLFWLNFKNKQKILLIKQNYENELRIKEAEAEERTRISRNLHDNLGAYASSVNHGLNLISNDGNNSDSDSLKDLKYAAQQIVLNLKNVVIELNQKPLGFIEFIDLLKSELLRVCKPYASIDFDIFEQLEFDKMLSPENQVHLKSIALEMVQNALKHSKATEIKFSIIESKGNIEIACSDNGCGLDDLNKSTGNGIANMKYRANLLKALFSIDKQSPNGTISKLTLNKSLSLS